MRTYWGAACILLLLSGCVENQFTGEELARCLDAAQAGVNRIPLCADERSCQTAFESHSQLISSGDFSTQTSLFRTQKNMVASWVALNQAESAVKKTREACGSGNIPVVFANGIGTAGRIKMALQKSEQSTLEAQQALRNAAEYGHKIELEKVRDSEAFEGYSRILEVMQEWETGNGTHSESQDGEQSKAYFERVARAITTNDIASYQPDWKGAFSIYQTMLKKSGRPEAPALLIFSPVWQSAISSFSSESRAQQGLSLLEEIKIPEMVNQIEENISPNGGIVFRWLERIKKMEDGIVALQKEEEETENRLSSLRAQLVQKAEQTTELKKKVDEWKNAVQAHLQNKDAESSEENEEKGMEKYADLQLEAGVLAARWNELHAQRVENRSTLGARIADWRKLAKEMGSGQEWINQAAEESEAWIQRCGDWAREIKQRKISDSDIQMKANNAIQGGAPLERAARCGEFVDATENHSSEIGSENEPVRARLAQCVNSRGEYAEALELNASGETIEYFESEFGLAAGLHACESSRLNLMNQYNLFPDVQEWHALSREANEKISAWNHAARAHPGIVPAGQATHFPETQDSTANENKPVGPGERQKKIAKLRTAVEKIDSYLSEIVQNGLNAIKWKAVVPEIIISNELDTFNLHVEWKNPFGQSVKISNAYRIPIPTMFSIVESIPQTQMETGQNGIAWEMEEIPFPGITWSGTGEGILVSTNETNKVGSITNTHAHMQRTIILSSALSNARVKWKWIPPNGIYDDRVNILENGRLVPFSRSGNAIVVEEEISAFPATRTILYEDPNAIRFTLTMVGVENGGGETTTLYQIELESALEEAVTTSISTGITGDPVNTLEIVAMEEEGGVIPTTRNAMWGVIIPNITIQPHEKRIVRIIVRMNEGVEDWYAWGQTLLDEANSIKEMGGMSLALRAGIIITEIQSGWSKRTMEEWGKKLPGWQSKIEKLRTEMEWEEMEWASQKTEWVRIQNLLDQNPQWKEKPEAKKWVQAGINAMRDENLSRFSDAIKALDKWITGQTPIVGGLLAENNELDDREIVNLSEVENIVDEWKQKLDEYVKARSLTCDKLAQVGFTCPIGMEKENQMQKESKEIKTNVGKDQKKRETKSAEEKRTWENERNAQWVEWKTTAEEGRTLTENGLSAIRETARALLDEISLKEKSETQESQSAIAKARIAFENGEYGKTVFIAKSLRAYWQQQAPFTGLAAIPPMGWPLVGIIILVGSGWAYQRWKNEKKPETIPISIPRAEENPSGRMAEWETEEWGDQSGFPTTQEESPPVSRGLGERETPPRQEQPMNEKGKALAGSTPRRKKSQRKVAPLP